MSTKAKSKLPCAKSGPKLVTVLMVTNVNLPMDSNNLDAMLMKTLIKQNHAMLFSKKVIASTATDATFPINRVIT